MARRPKKRHARGGPRRPFRRSGSAKRSRARRNDWTARGAQEWDELEHDRLERIMRRDERDRRRWIEEAATASPPTASAESQPPAPAATAAADARTALVTAVAGMSARIDLHGQERPATIRGLLTELDTGYINPVAVGDRAIVEEDGAGAWAIVGIQPRATTLARPDPFLAPRLQVVAANVDRLLIVSSWREPDLWLELIDRYLIAAALSNIEPIVCVNKADLIEDEAECESAIGVYRRMGLTTLIASATTGRGIAELRAALAEGITVMAGLSGTGKSSLMAAVQPGLDIRVGAVSDASGQGRHTTTRAEMHRLDSGGYVADTPGIREFGLAGLTLGELPLHFPEIDRAAADCRFSNCAHLEEPRCAVRAAELRGDIPASRVASYRAIFDELEV